jgi:hypothetical protein
MAEARGITGILVKTVWKLIIKTITILVSNPQNLFRFKYSLPYQIAPIALCTTLLHQARLIPNPLPWTKKVSFQLALIGNRRKSLAPPPYHDASQAHSRQRK